MSSNDFTPEQQRVLQQQASRNHQVGVDGDDPSEADAAKGQADMDRPAQEAHPTGEQQARENAERELPG